jgi:hypothetical protein
MRGWVLDDVILDAVFRSGAVTGSIMVVVEMLGGLGAGPVISFGGVREISDAACGVLPAGMCGDAGCASSPAREVQWNGTQCSCGSATSVCFAEAGTAPATGLWARPYPLEDDFYEVLALDAVTEPLSDPWVPCSALSDVPACECFDGENACP